MHPKIDFKKELKQFFQPPRKDFVEVTLPKMRFVAAEGAGDPNSSDAYATALSWLYASSYAMKFDAKTTLGRDYVVPPLEGLWWADDPADFVKRNKSAWKWTMMIMMPDFVTDAMFDAAKSKAEKKLGARPATLRIEELHEGRCLQIMHIGSYDEEGPTLATLHDQLMPKRGLTFNGPHHEIYIGDPRKVPPERLKTVLRQPVRSLTD